MRDHVNGLAQGSSLNACVSPQSWWCFTWRFSRDHVLNATRNGTILLDHINSFIQSASKRTPNCRMVYVCSAQRWLFLFSWAQNALIYFCSNMLNRFFFVLTRTKNITFSFCTERFNYRLKFVLVGTNLYRRNKSIKSIKSFPSKRKSENFRSGQNKTNLFILLRMSFVQTRTKKTTHFAEGTKKKLCISLCNINTSEVFAN